MPGRTRILVVGNSLAEAERLQALLAPMSDCAFEVRFLHAGDTQSLDSYWADTADVLIAGLSDGVAQGNEAYAAVLQKSSEVPLILLAERDDASVAARAIQSGVQDFLVAGEVTGPILARSIRHAVERQRQLIELRFALASEKILMEELDKKNKELVELSITDGLTGLYNHRFIQERFDFEFKRARRYGSPLSCLLIDIDHFKTVNDTWGHQFGDLVLMEIAAILRDRSREVDICGRYGGEEFMVIATLTADGAMKLASKLHTAVENHVFSDGKNTVHVTVSIGIAEYRADTKVKQDLIERSDTAMYWAKRDGRNMIRLWKEVEGDEILSLDQMGIEGLKTEFVRLSTQMRATYMESTNALVNAIDAKDHYTREHSRNVSEYAVRLACAMKLPEKDIEVIKYAGLLHDIGKIGINQDILCKRGELTKEEFEVLRKHPTIGAGILKDVKFLEKEIPLVLHHHEHYDGSGYPHGLKEREIPLGARILAVVDAYDAMTTVREYRRKLSDQEAISELVRNKETQFAPEMVDAFLKVLSGEAQ
jgi:diguanylate cyclase (GGDEF)-like protein/putative nucleotidyltransferase with HDIG domain